MPTLMIVDDDPNIRRGLQHLLDWDEFGIQIIGEASGGLEAWEIVQQLRPNFLITDIRMPHGTGLELIELITSSGYKTQIIVLSGYGDFDYVRQAMKYQVVDYLLKPVDAEELSEIMKTCITQLRKNWIAEALENESFQMLKNNVLLRWVENRIDIDQLSDKFEFLELRIQPCNLFQVSVIYWDHIIENEIREEEKEFRSFSIFNIVNEKLSEMEKAVTCMNQDRSIVCIFMDRSDDKTAFHAMNQTYLTELANRYSRRLKIPWYITMGEVCTEAGSVHKSYLSALELKDYLYTMEPLACIDSTIRTRFHRLPVTGLNDIQRQINELVSGKGEDWKDLMNKQFNWAHDQRVAKETAQQIAIEWLISLKQVLKELKVKLDLSLIEREILPLLFSKELESRNIQTQMEAILIRVKHGLQEATKGKSNSLVSQVEQYIHMHYSQELTLQMLADRFYVNKTYLGRLFKEETGDFYSDYLNRIRLEHAMELLEKTTMKASDIGIHVGYLDPNYFFRKFRQLAGMSPTDYRKLKSFM